MERNQKVEDYMRIIYRLRENGLVLIWTARSFLSAEQIILADTDGNGVTDINDVTLLQMYPAKQTKQRALQELSSVPFEISRHASPSGYCFQIHANRLTEIFKTYLSVVKFIHPTHLQMQAICGFSALFLRLLYYFLRLKLTKTIEI